MNVKFSIERSLIIVPVRFNGVKKSILSQFAVDTGATHSLINTDLAVILGYDPATSTDRVQITTGSGIVYATRIIVKKINAIGKSILDFPILCHTLPPSAEVDGLLGLDFFYNSIIKIDLKKGEIDISN